MLLLIYLSMKFLFYYLRKLTFTLNFSLKVLFLFWILFLCLLEKICNRLISFSCSYKRRKSKSDNLMFRSNGAPQRSWGKFHKHQIISFLGEEKKHICSLLAPSQSEQCQKLHRKDSISHFKLLWMDKKIIKECLDIRAFDLRSNMET